MGLIEGLKEKRSRRTKPVLEGLEGRQLLAAQVGSAVHEGPILAPKFIAYQTPSGGVATIQLLGPGNLVGSSIDPDGALRLVYDNTSPNSIILGKVRGGSGFAPIRSIDDADVAPTTFSGVNGNLLNTVRLGKFDLVSGGAVNLTAGVGKLYLRSAMANSQIHVRDIPNATPVETSLQLNSLTSPTAPPFGGPAFLGLTAPLIGTNNNNTPFTVPSVFSSQGRVQGYTTDDFGAVNLRSVSGTFVPGENQEGIAPNGSTGPNPGIPGVLINIGQIIGIDPVTAPVLIDVQGNLQGLKAGGANGLYLNGSGNVGIVQIKNASNSRLFGYPFGHVNLANPAATGVKIYSTARVVGGRGGVSVNGALTPQGPLSLPLPSTAL